jgi:hypothetical protein
LNLWWRGNRPSCCAANAASCPLLYDASQSSCRAMDGARRRARCWRTWLFGLMLYRLWSFGSRWCDLCKLDVICRCKPKLSFRAHQCPIWVSLVVNLEGFIFDKRQFLVCLTSVIVERLCSANRFCLSNVSFAASI